MGGAECGVVGAVSGLVGAKLEMVDVYWRECRFFKLIFVSIIRHSWIHLMFYCIHPVLLYIDNCVVYVL